MDNKAHPVLGKTAPRQRGFLWELSGEKGAILRSGRVEAVTLSAARVKLRRFYPDLPSDRFLVRPEPRQWFPARVPEEQIVGFLRQFSTMARAGIPVIERLDALLETEMSAPLQTLVGGLRKSLNDGQSMSQAFTAYPRYFSTQELAMLRVGELGGAMEEVLAQMATYREKTHLLNKKIRSALLYPAVIVFVMVVVITVILLYVIPVFAHLFHSFGAQLPLSTRIAIDISYFVKDHLLLLFGLPVVAGFLGARAYARSSRVHWLVDRALLKVPVFGPLLLKGGTSRMLRTLSLLYESGVPIQEALLTLKGISGNALLDDAVAKAAKSVHDGSTIASSWRSTYIPKLAQQYIRIGEASGTLGEMAGKAADYYAQEVEETVARLSTLLEPFILIVLGVVVGGLLVAMYTPIFEMGAVVTHGH